MISLTEVHNADVFSLVLGDQWFRSFLHRYRSELSVRKPESVTKASANVTEADIRKWFREVLELLREDELEDILSDPKRMLNGDETSFYLDPTVDKVIAMRGERNVYKVDQGQAKKNITVMFTCSADGKIFPPMVVLPYKKIPLDVTQSVPSEWGVGKTDSGWMNKECFLKYIVKILHPQLAEENLLPVIYFVDGHSSHTAWETAEEAAKLGIILVCLYPNCTRILQPLDVSVFKPLKTSWLKVVDDWKLKYPKQPIKSQNFSPLLQKAMESINDRIVQNGFKTCGLYPFDENNVDYSKCLARNSNYRPTAEIVDDPNESHTAEERGTIENNLKTFAVLRSDAEKVLEMMGPFRRARYRQGNEDFTSEDDEILAKVYDILKPIDTEDLMFEEYLIETEGDASGAVVEENEWKYAPVIEPVDLFQEFEEKLNEPQSPLELANMEESRADETDAPELDEEQGSSFAEKSIIKKSDTPETLQEQKSALADFLESPETPRRAGTLRFKRRSPAVLTSRRRLEYHKAKAEQRKKEEEEKQRKSELRKNKKKSSRKPKL